MTTATTMTIPERIARRVRAGLADMRYAQQRVFENRTGIPASSGARVGLTGLAATPDELDALYTLDTRMTWR